MGSTYTELQLYNMALGEITDQPLTAIASTYPRGRDCVLYYPQARDEALELHPWRFASARSTLARDGATIDISDETGAPAAVVFRPNGLIMYVLGGSSVYQYTLTDSFDQQTATYASKSFSFATEEATPTGIAFNPSGTKMYMVGTTDQIVEQYTLATPWDVSTAVVDVVQLDVSSEDTAPEGITFGNSGLALYVVGNTGNAIFQYVLTTAYDLSTASYDTKTISVAVEDTNPTSVVFKTDGLAMFVAGSQSDAVHQYTLSTAWNVSTATADGTDFQVVDDDTGMTGIFLNPDGTRLFFVGIENDEVISYGMSVAYDLSTADGSSPPFTYSYRFAAPADMIRAIEFGHIASVEEPNWEEEDGFLLSDETYFDLNYTKRVTTIGKFSPLCIQVVVLNLAAKLAISLKGDKALQGQLIARRSGVIAQAELADARAGNRERSTAPHGWTDREGDI